MRLIYSGRTYECVSAQKKPNEIVIRTGKHTEDGTEVIYHIYGDIDFSEVRFEGGTWADEGEKTIENRVETLEESNAALTEAVDMILSGVTE